MEKILNKEDLEFLRELAHELKTQDNLCTRKPLVFQIADKRIEWIPTTEIDGEYGVFLNDDWTNYDEESLREYIKDEYEVDIEDFEEMLEFLDEHDIKYTEARGIEKIEYKGAFLTSRAARNHFECNDYHYGADSYVWCDSGWRNPELEKLLNIIEKFDVEG
jgi:hypothetical protein